MYSKLCFLEAVSFVAPETAVTSPSVVLLASSSSLLPKGAVALAGSTKSAAIASACVLVSLMPSSEVISSFTLALTSFTIVSAVATASGLEFFNENRSSCNLLILSAKSPTLSLFKVGVALIKSPSTVLYSALCASMSSTAKLVPSGFTTAAVLLGDVGSCLNLSLIVPIAEEIASLPGSKFIASPAAAN